MADIRAAATSALAQQQLQAAAEAKAKSIAEAEAKAKALAEKKKKENADLVAKTNSNPTLKKGDKNDNVKVLQTKLNLTADGSFGNKRVSIKKWFSG